MCPENRMVRRRNTGRFFLFLWGFGLFCELAVMARFFPQFHSTGRVAIQADHPSVVDAPRPVRIVYRLGHLVAVVWQRHERVADEPADWTYLFLHFEVDMGHTQITYGTYGVLWIWYRGWWVDQQSQRHKEGSIFARSKSMSISRQQAAVWQPRNPTRLPVAPSYLGVADSPEYGFVWK